MQLLSGLFAGHEKRRRQCRTISLQDLYTRVAETGSGLHGTLDPHVPTVSMIANVPGASLSSVSVSVSVSPTPASPQPPQPRHHRVRGLSFLRRPRGNTPSPPVSPPERATLERATSYPLNSPSAPAPVCDSADSEDCITTPYISTTLAPDSSMARLRRAFSSQNGTSPQQHTSTSAPQHHRTPATPATPASPSPGLETPNRSSNSGVAQHGILANLMDGANGVTGGRDGLAPDQMPTIKFIQIGRAHV